MIDIYREVIAIYLHTIAEMQQMGRKTAAKGSSSTVLGVNELKRFYLISTLEGLNNSWNFEQSSIGKLFLMVKIDGKRKGSELIEAINQSPSFHQCVRVKISANITTLIKVNSLESFFFLPAKKENAQKFTKETLSLGA